MQVTKETLDHLATTHDYRSGKWMAFVPWSQVDSVWQALVRAFLRGQLKEAVSLRASSFDLRHPSGGRRRCPVFVRTADFLDEAEVVAARDAIRKAGFKGSLK